MSSPTPRPEANHQQKWLYPYAVPSETADATLIFYAVKGRAIHLERVSLSSYAGQAADASNFVNFKLVKNGTTVIASWSTQTGHEGALTANTPVELTYSTNAADLHLKDGDTLGVFVDTTGTITVAAVQITAEGYEL